jgi:hypothetical protein
LGELGNNIHFAAQDEKGVEFKTGAWKLRRTRKGFQKGRRPLCRAEENYIHILLKHSETKKWRENFLSTNGLLLMKR